MLNDHVNNLIRAQAKSIILTPNKGSINYSVILHNQYRNPTAIYLWPGFETRDTMLLMIGSCDLSIL
jgi:hypothetical protein